MSDAASPSRRQRLETVHLYVVATPEAHGPGWEQALRAALATGLVGMVQLREKTLDDRPFLARARRVRKLAHDHGALFLVNDRVHLTHEAQADGAHVGQDDLPCEEARQILGPDLLVGLSTHDADEVRTASARGADHVGLGPCFATTSKTLDRALGGASLIRRCLPAALSLPVFPIGGIGPGNAPQLAAAGATRVAVGASVLEAQDPAEAVRRLHACLVSS